MEIVKLGLEEAFDLYYRFDSKKIEKIYHLREKARAKMDKMKLDSITARFMRHNVKIIEDAADLIHLTIMNNPRDCSYFDALRSSLRSSRSTKRPYPKRHVHACISWVVQ
jgi:hypothetical protein